MILYSTGLGVSRHSPVTPACVNAFSKGFSGYLADALQESHTVGGGVTEDNKIHVAYSYCYVYIPADISGNISGNRGNNNQLRGLVSV